MVINTINKNKEQKLELIGKNENNSIGFVLKSHKIIDGNRHLINFEREQFELSIGDVKKLIEFLKTQI